MTKQDWIEPISVEDMYGDWDWEGSVERVDRSLNPRPSASMLDAFEELALGPDDVVLDIGGRAGAHCLMMAERFGCRAVSVDPSDTNNADAAQAVADHEFGRLVDVRPGTIEAIPAEDSAFDFEFSRDMFAHVRDADIALDECYRVLKPGGAMVLHQVFGTDLLEPWEAEQLAAHTASVVERFDVSRFEAACRSAGFRIERVEVIGSEWAEAMQETDAATNYLLQVSRLRRAKEELVEAIGEVAYRAMLGNALWTIYQVLGKLESRVYVLRRTPNS
ncbi:MAG: methyltransferase domain-containing protein [Actinomycetota bacterium]